MLVLRAWILFLNGNQLASSINSLLKNHVAVNSLSLQVRDNNIKVILIQITNIPLISVAHRLHRTLQ